MDGWIVFPGFAGFPAFRYVMVGQLLLLLQVVCSSVIQLELLFSFLLLLCIIIIDIERDLEFFFPPCPIIILRTTCSAWVSSFFLSHFQYYYSIILPENTPSFLRNIATESVRNHRTLCTRTPPLGYPTYHILKTHRQGFPIHAIC